MLWIIFKTRCKLLGQSTTTIQYNMYHLILNFFKFEFYNFLPGKYIPSAFPFGVLYNYQGKTKTLNLKFIKIKIPLLFC